MVIKYNTIIDTRETFNKNALRFTNFRSFNIMIARFNQLLDNSAELIEYLTKIQRPLVVEKNQHGEVFTPPKLINDMLDGLERVAPNIWSNPSLRILDPAAGIGNFGALIYERLMRGLSGAIPDENDRRAHILRNMLYMCEINPKNVRICRAIFRTSDAARGCPHIYEYDFLDKNSQRILGGKSFDIIVGNPPYNAPRSSDGRAHGKTLYMKFAIKCIQLLASNGYQVMVHPGTWRKPRHECHDLMFDDVHIHRLEIYSKKAGQKMFGATTRYDWYVLQLAKHDGRASVIRFDDGEIIDDFSISREIPFIPNHGWSILNKMWARARDCGTFSISHGSNNYIVENLDREHIWPYVNSTCTSKELSVHWSAIAHPIQYLPKVVFSDNEVIYPYYDPGFLGITGHGIAQVVANAREGLYLCRYLRSHLMQYINNACTWSMFRTEYTMFESLPWPRKCFQDDADIYAYFGLSDGEIEKIEDWIDEHPHTFTEHIERVCDPAQSIKDALAQLRDKESLAVDDDQHADASPAPDVAAESTDDDDDDFASMTVAQLRELAKEAKIKRYSKMKRAELIEALSQ